MKSSVLMVLVIILHAGALYAEPPSESQVVAWMRELKPLSKVHYSWPLPWKSISDDVLFEYVRLTHAASLSGEWGQPEQIERAVQICHRVNFDRPKIPASIGINYSVWHRRFGKDLPPTDTGPDASGRTGLSAVSHDRDARRDFRGKSQVEGGR